jgi:hypothetical protein
LIIDPITLIDFFLANKKKITRTVFCKIFAEAIGFARFPFPVVNPFVGVDHNALTLCVVVFEAAVVISPIGPDLLALTTAPVVQPLALVGRSVREMQYGFRC